MDSSAPQDLRPRRRETAEHRRARTIRSQDHTVTRIAAASARLAGHHGLSIPQALATHDIQVQHSYDIRLAGVESELAHIS
eukprot:11600298-Karenia_brevis.AAC.1